jgi:bifunctional non-homologous end joining protein LigD
MKSVAHAASRLPVTSAILDGEVVVLDEKGGSSFSMLQAAFDEGAAHPLTCFAFDLLHLDGSNLRGLPLLRRKQLLEKLLKETASETLVYSEHVEASAEETFRTACELGAEGIVSKLGTSKYVGGRSKDWLKLKCVRRQEFVIGGYTLPSNGGAGIGALLLGVYEGERLVYCGRTGTGFTQPTHRMLRGRLDALAQQKSAFASALPADARKGALWVRPELVAEVQFATWTADGMVRHAAFQGLREDKPAAEVVREDSVRGGEAKRDGAAGKAASPAQASSAKSAPIRLTHPDKIIDAETGVTKRQLADYLYAVAGVMLPHIANRPLSLVRCPDGSAKPCFFQKHAGQGLPAGVGSVTVPSTKNGPSEEYISLDTADALASLAQIGVLEVHPWGSCNRALERPDRLIFDLDPDEAIEWAVLVESARAVRGFLEELGLTSFVKTTGGKGLHVVVPLAAAAGAPEWPEIKDFTRGVALAIESTDRKLYLIKMTKAARKGRIFIDYMRNERGATAVAAYSPRARSGLRVALPLEWDELDQGRPEFSVANFPEWEDRLARAPWARLPGLQQKIDKKVLAAVAEAGRQG